jgi:hypothetical protein
MIAQPCGLQTIGDHAIEADDQGFYGGLAPLRASRSSNARKPLQRRPVETGKEILAALPQMLQYAEWKRCTVAADYHVPGCFVIIAEPYAFRKFGTTLDEYFAGSIEPSYLYLLNRFINYAHARCLSEELEMLGVTGRKVPPGFVQWPLPCPPVPSVVWRHTGGRRAPCRAISTSSARRLERQAESFYRNNGGEWRLRCANCEMAKASEKYS